LATWITSATTASARRDTGESGHKLRLLLAWILAIGLLVGLSIYGFPYYWLGIEERPFSPLHPILRPSGSIGLRLGMFGTALFCVLFLYPLRKRWTWLGQIGKTSHWLDFHVLIGITAPLFITFHASFKLRGMVGVAYWIMIAVALSGFIGRYMYAQIPRSLNAVQLTMGEIQAQAEELAGRISGQSLFQADEIAPLLAVPTPSEVRAMSLGGFLWTALRLDLARPFRASKLRRRVLTGFEWVTTLGGLRPSSHEELEAVISGLQAQAWLRAKIAFLDRAQQVFHLWHVVHRPFSYSFAALVIIHITVVMMMGYY
jgi:hypothetical protein